MDDKFGLRANILKTAETLKTSASLKGVLETIEEKHVEIDIPPIVGNSKIYSIESFMKD